MRLRETGCLFIINPRAAAAAAFIYLGPDGRVAECILNLHGAREKQTHSQGKVLKQMGSLLIV